MKKTFALILALCMILSLCACGQQTDKPPASDPPAQPPAAGPDKDAAQTPEESIQHIYDGVAPLDSKTDLTIATLAGSHHAFIVFLMEKMGAYEKAGINSEIVTFGNGPVQMEALVSDSWDCGTTGLGGVLVGASKYGAYIIGAAAQDRNSLRIFAKNDTDIVKEGVTTDNNVYGTADAWKGQEILVTTGSTLHYTLAVGLNELGLELDAVNLTHMDVASVNTALLADQGSIGGVWGSYAYGEALNSRYTPVMNAKDLGLNICVVLVANPNSYNDPAKHDAIAKYVEMYYKTIDWVYASEENTRYAAELFTEINEENGVVGTVEENYTTLTNDTYYTLEESYNMFHDKTTAADGTEMTVIEEAHYGPLDFYVANGYYEPDTLSALLQGNFKSDILDAIYKK